MARKLTKPRPKQGAHLARLRKAVGLSQAQLAHLVGESQGNIAFWEVSAKPPSSDVLPALAKALGVQIPDLIVSSSSASAASPLQKPLPAKLLFLFDQILSLPPSHQKDLIHIISIFLHHCHSSSRSS